MRKNLSKMITMMLPEIRHSKHLVRLKDDSRLKESLENLQVCSEKLENALLDNPSTEEAKDLLKESAQVLKAEKKKQEMYDVA